jgi:tyrosinase
MAVRIRKSVWSLPPGDPILVWFRRAVDALIQKPASDPSSWRYLASVHGTRRGMPVPPGAGQFWDQCQHQSWFFLPWHRGYIASFEAVVAKTIADLGGPDDWGLPYWNYSESQTSNPNARLMHPDFRDQLLPNGNPNRLWSRRAQVQNGNFGLGSSAITLGALQLQNFTNPGPGAPGFGGPATGFSHFGGASGALENLPHNRIHVLIGGANGFMSDPATAALDPIFWLHHCNIDRLWEVWRNQGPQFANPTTPQWLTAVSFNMHDGNGNPWSFVSRDMLDTTRVLGGYRYDNVPVAQEPAPSPLEAVTVAAGRNPELVGTNEGPIPLEGDVTRTTVTLQPEAIERRSGLETTAAQRVYLNLENITGTGVPGDFNVYIDMPGDREPRALAGVMTTFGLERASDPAGGHCGSGLSQIFDITELAQRLGITQGTVAQLQVTFEREGVPPAEEAVPPGLEAYVQAAPAASNIRVGRVSLYYE